MNFGCYNENLFFCQVCFSTFAKPVAHGPLTFLWQETTIVTLVRVADRTWKHNGKWYI